jgi:hypothetical protein
VRIFPLRRGHLGLALLAVAVVLTMVAPALAQTDAPTAVRVGFTPQGGLRGTAVQLVVQGAPPSNSVTVVLLSPSLGQLVIHSQTDANGSLVIDRAGLGGLPEVGLYRAAVVLNNGRTVSATYASEDNAPHFSIGGDLPSTNGAFNLMGVGLPPSQTLSLRFTLANGMGVRTVSVTTDAVGSFQRFLWAEAFGLGFWPAGGYRFAAEDGSASLTFFVREHPGQSSVAVDGTVTAGVASGVHFHHYPSGRYLWAVYAQRDGTPLGEFLVGPTDFRGEADSYLDFGSLATGSYLLATPYDWGETQFSALAPTATATATPNLTPTSTRTATPTAKPTKTPCKRAKPKNHKKKRTCHK